MPVFVLFCLVGNPLLAIPDKFTHYLLITKFGSMRYDAAKNPTFNCLTYTHSVQFSSVQFSSYHYNFTTYNSYRKLIQCINIKYNDDANTDTKTSKNTKTN